MALKYKKSYLVINIVLVLTLLFLVLNMFTFQITSYLFAILSVLIPFMVIFLIYGYEHKKRRFMYELIFYVFAYSILLLLISYIIGIFVGFSQNVYKLNMVTLIHNIIPYLILIILSETLRYEITRKGEESLTSHILVSLIFVAIDMTLFLKSYNLDIGDEQIKYVCGIVLPSIFKNTLLIYLARIGGIVPGIIYRIIFDLRIILLPILPNYGLYFESIANCILPVLMWLLVEISLRQFKKRELDKSYMGDTSNLRYVLLAILFSIVLAVNLLSSGKLKYTVVSIGSGSMSPIISKGDAVIYEKYDGSLIDVGEILVFKKENKMVVHRIIEVVEVSEGEYVYYTKGDANESPDGYPIETSDILGIVRQNIKYIGMPSVMLGELINR